MASDRSETGEPRYNLHLLRHAAASLFFAFNDSRTLPATPCDMNATWPGKAPIGAFRFLVV